MVAIPYLFNEIEKIFRNVSFSFYLLFYLQSFEFKQTPLYTIVLEALLLLSVIWLIFYKRNGRKRYTKTEEDEIIANYNPEPLVDEVDPNHPFLRTRLVNSKIGKRVTVNSVDCLNLATHNYLGLLEDDKILKDACESLRKYGVGSCGPRGFYGTMGKS